MTDTMTETMPDTADCPMMAKPQQEHEWLQQLVGEWDFEGECMMAPDQPPMKSTGTCSTRSLGGLWFLCEGSGEMPGGGMMNSIITLGYDPQEAALCRQLHRVDDDPYVAAMKERAMRPARC